MKNVEIVMLPFIVEYIRKEKIKEQEQEREREDQQVTILRKGCSSLVLHLIL
jgi:hypothetical protein